VETHSLAFGKIQPIRLDYALALHVVGDSGLEPAVHTFDLYDDALVLYGKPWQKNLDPIAYRRHKRC
jgi:hypothetical protein